MKSTNSVIAWLLPYRNKKRTLSAAFVCAVTLAHAVDSCAADIDPQQAEARALFERFIAAQNAHDSVGVEKMLWNSPDFLWVSRGVQIRSSSQATALYKSYYSATWQVAPDMSTYSAATLTDGVVQILVSIEFTRGAANQPPQKARYLISQTIVRKGDGWHIASILPVTDTKLK